MRMYFRELKTNTKSLLVWTIVIAFLIIVAVGKFAAFADNPESLAILDSMPPQLLDALHMRSFNLTTIEGFYGAMFTYFVIIGAMAAALWGSEVISKEERDRTVEFTLVLPVSRYTIATSKLLAALTHCALFVLFTWLISVYSVQAYQPRAGFYDFLRLEMISMFLVEMIFLSFGMMLACISVKPRNVGSMTVGVILGMYFLSILSGMNQRLDWLKWLTPFGWFNPGEIYRNGQIEPLSIILTAVSVIVFLFVGYSSYSKRDLYI